MTAPALALPPLPQPYSVDEAIDRLLIAAASQIGYREGRTGGSWNNDNAYGVWYGSNRVAWCAQFMSWCAHQAGDLDKIIPRHQYTPSGWGWFKERGLTVSSTGSPRPGDLLYVYGYVASEDRSRIHHVGIVEKVLAGGYIQTIEGNTNTGGSSQGNGVYRLKRQVTPRLRFARPAYAQVVKARPKPPPGQPVLPPIRVTTLSLAAMKYAARHDGMSHAWAAQRLAALSTIAVLLGDRSAYPPKGVGWAAHFRAQWKRWQRYVSNRHKLDWTARDIDGIPGAESLRYLALHSGRRATK